MPDYPIHKAIDPLTPHFRVLEFFQSADAKRLDLSNYPVTEADYKKVVVYLRELSEAILEPIRRHFGKPIIINSGYRSQLVNRAVGGALNSQHTQGKAADIVVKGTPVREVFDWISSSGLPFDQIIYEVQKSEWVHVSHDPIHNRGSVLQSLRSGSYEPYKAL